MSANTLGKTLVFVQLIFSVLAGTFAAGIYMQRIDFGWKEPRKDLYLRVPSEIDKRTAAVQEALRAKDMSMSLLKTAQADRGNAEPRYWTNHAWYRQQLARLRSDPNPIDAKEVKMLQGIIQVDTPPDKPRFGKPILENPVPGIQKSYDKYVEDLNAKQKEIDKVEESIKQIAVQERDITYKLTGKDADGKLVTFGLYALLVDEKKRQEQMKFETDYLQPLWVEALDRAELFLERKLRLERTLAGMTGNAVKQ
jgi:hypothetical protein